LGEDGADGRPHHLLGCLGHQREGIPHEVNPNPLPGGSYQKRRNGSLQTSMGRRLLRASLPKALWRPKNARRRSRKRRPRCLTHVEAKHLSLAVLCLHPHSYDHRDRGHMSLLAGFHVSGVDPHVGVSAFERRAPENARPPRRALRTARRRKALGDAPHPRAFTNSSTLRVEMPCT
jgi:hypothetical protein